MTLDLKQLEAFVWTADLGSFSKAASRLNTTQPNISIRIRSLETSLNVTLLERDAGSVRLTARGQDLLMHARQALNAAENMIVASGEPSLREGTLRLGVTEMIVHTWLQRFLKTLKEQFPSLHVELTIDLSENLSKELFERNIDLAFQNGPFDRIIGGTLDLGTYPLTWVASPALGLPKGRKISAAKLGSQPILTHARDTPLFTELSEHFKNVGVKQPRLVPSSNLAACLFMSINAMGVATVPRSMVVDALQRGEVVELQYAWKPQSLDFVARFDREKSPLYVDDIAKLASRVSSDFRSVADFTAMAAVGA